MQSLPASMKSSVVFKNNPGWVAEIWSFREAKYEYSDKQTENSAIEGQIVSSMIHAGESLIGSVRGGDRILKRLVNDGGGLVIQTIKRRTDEDELFLTDGTYSGFSRNTGNEVKGQEYSELHMRSSVDRSGDCPCGFVVLYNKGCPLKVVLNPDSDMGNRADELMLGHEDFAVMVYSTEIKVSFIPVRNPLHMGDLGYTRFILSTTVFGRDIREKKLRELVS